MDRLGRADGTSAKERRAVRMSKRGLVTFGKGRPRGLHQREILAYLVEERGDTCGICNRALGELALCNIDHIIPLGKGGTNAWSNLQPAHIVCNNAKGDTIGFTITDSTGGDLQISEESS